MNRRLINSAKTMTSDGTTQHNKLTIGMIAVVLFLILGALVPLISQVPVQQQPPNVAKQSQQLSREERFPERLALYRQTLQTFPDSLGTTIEARSVLDLVGNGQEAGDYFTKASELADAPEGNATAKRAIATSLVGESMLAAVSTRVLSSSAAQAQGEVPEIRVAVLIAPPLIVEQNGSLTGFSIDLWNAIAARLKVRTSYKMVPDVSAAVEALRSDSVELIPGFAITSARDEVFDFTYPTLESGLQIMVRETGATQGTTGRLRPILDMLHLLVSRTTVEWFGVALLLVLIPAHIVWLFERRQQDGLISNKHYFPGIFEAFYWGLATLAAQVEAMPRQWIARSLAVLWMFASVVFIASYTAQLTTTLTVEQIRGAIEGPDDLAGKQVATLAASPAVDYLREMKAQVQEFPTPSQMYSALLDNKVDAVVTQAPLLLYYAAHEGKGRVKVVGPQFVRRPLAIMVQLNSPCARGLTVCWSRFVRTALISKSTRSGSAQLSKGRLKGIEAATVLFEPLLTSRNPI